MKMDIEVLIDAIREILDAQLNDKITEIETEKDNAGKGVVNGLATVESLAFFCQTWDDRILNYSPSIFYGVEDIATISVQSATAQKVKVFVDVVLVSNQNISDDTWRRINRYSRALKEVMESNVRKLNQLGAHSVTIETVRPATFRLALDNSEEVKIGGIELQVVII